MSFEKMVYFYGNGMAEGSADMKNILGGKGANLHEMSKLGIPVPPGFTITTEVCIYYANKKVYPDGLKEKVDKDLKKMEEVVGKKFGDMNNPLLVSVRSGARVSMPGMMDTVLNLGLNDSTLQGLIKQSGNERFSYDSYRRFIQMYGDVVMGIDHDNFEEILTNVKNEAGVKLDTQLNVENFKEIIKRYKTMIKDKFNKEFPEDPQDQLWGAIGAVFGSWNNYRAIQYRKINNISDDWGTAVNIVAMVYGNMGDDSATGVAFTRDPATGEKKFFGEFLINAQGEDVVAGIRTPQHITKLDSQEWAEENNIDEETRKNKYPSLEEYMPDVYKQLVDIYHKLESHYRDMQDMEFTIEKGHLYLLQTRTGKRTGKAAVKIAVDMVNEGVISKEEAILRVSPDQLDQLLHPMLDLKAAKGHKPITKGLPASPGAVNGQIIFNALDAAKWADDGKKVILVRHETSPEDIKGMQVSQGILTARGGMTSHAAVVGRGMGKCCVVGCGALDIDYDKKEVAISGTDIVLKEGDVITLDGSTGRVYKGALPTMDPEFTEEYNVFMKWVDEIRTMGVRTNADTPQDAKRARSFGAEGIGLCRTEHMFFGGNRIKAMREMILADNLEDREKALAKLLPMQENDFYEIMKVMEGLPVIIRLLDPPLHEFLPHEEKEQKELANDLGISLEKIQYRVESLHEMNPMLGHRGCRLGITYPEINKMQITAILSAAARLKKEGVDVKPEIMVPLVGDLNEFLPVKKMTHELAKEMFEKYGVKFNYLVGTMIEIPRAALLADEIAKEAEFFSFGTNDLTQMTFGLSRDDAGRFLPSYVEKKILPADPFQKLDQKGVGKLVEMATKNGKAANPKLEVGICGEHGGEPTSVEFCYRTGLDYVSCSPFRVPIARLASAQATIKDKK